MRNANENGKWKLGMGPSRNTRKNRKKVTGRKRERPAPPPAPARVSSVPGGVKTSNLNQPVHPNIGVTNTEGRPATGVCSRSTSCGTYRDSVAGHDDIGGIGAVLLSAALNRPNSSVRAGGGTGITVAMRSRGCGDGGAGDVIVRGHTVGTQSAVLHTRFLPELNGRQARAGAGAYDRPPSGIRQRKRGSAIATVCRAQQGK